MEDSLNKMAVHVLASGSKGNATLIVYKNTVLLVDAGISARRIVQGIRSVGLTPEQLSGICITHEHTDHMSGLAQLVKQYDVPVYTKTGTMREIMRRKDVNHKQFIELSKNNLCIGDLAVDIFKISHDAVDPIGLSCYGGNNKVTFMTDTGIVSEPMLKHMDDSNLLVLEANYDPQMLRYGPYPAELKRRVAGNEGHLSNECAARALVMMRRPEKMKVVMAHRSEKNNAEPVVDHTLNKLLQQEGLAVGTDLQIFHGQPKEIVSIHQD